MARDGDEIVFVEVKTRSGEAYGHPFEAITPAKLAPIATTCLRVVRCARCAAAHPGRRDLGARAQGRRRGGRAPRGGGLMAVARTSAVTLLGLRGSVVEIEADMSDGMPGFVLIGPPDTALREAVARVKVPPGTRRCRSRTNGSP